MGSNATWIERQLSYSYFISWASQARLSVSVFYLVKMKNLIALFQIVLLILLWRSPPQNPIEIQAVKSSTPQKLHDIVRQN